MECLGVLNLDGFGIGKGTRPRRRGRAGPLRQRNPLRQAGKLRKLREYSSEKTLLLDPATCNLEIFKSAANTRRAPAGGMDAPHLPAPACWNAGYTGSTSPKSSAARTAYRNSSPPGTFD